MNIVGCPGPAKLRFNPLYSALPGYQVSGVVFHPPIWEGASFETEEKSITAWVEHTSEQ